MTDTYELNITGMDCTNCAKTLETGIGKMEGVTACSVNFMSSTMHVEGKFDTANLHQKIAALGYGVAQESNSVQLVEDYAGVAGFIKYMLSRTETALALGSLGVLVIIIALALAGVSSPLIDVAELGIIVLVGLPIMRRGINEFIMSRNVTINLLMAIATIGALVIDEWMEAATVITLFAIGEALEGYSADRARGALKSLLMLAPDQAIVAEADEDKWVPVKEIKPGTTIIVPAGSRIPLDGVITKGASAIDQSPITGESIPVDKTPGDEVFAGTVNGNGVLHIEVTHPAGESTLARIIKLVEDAQAKKSPTERFVDRFAAWYTPAVVGLAIVVAAIPPLLFSASFDVWLYRALALLVVACPCALVISTPVTVVSAMVRAAQQGVLIKGGAYLEALGKIKTFAFDKTGTLTQGQPQVVDVHTVGCMGTPGCPVCNEMLGLASAVERHSEHPLGQAIVRHAQQVGVFANYNAAEHITTLTGRGITGQVATQDVVVGSHAYFDERYPHPMSLCQAANQHETQGETVMLVAQGDDVLGYISVADTPRPAAQQALANLQDAHKVMLTGDNATVAKAIAAKVGIDEVKASLLPEQKSAVIQDLAQRPGGVAMVGDGINDAPALAAATVGIAMGGAGTAQAMETADVVLMQDDLSQLPFAVQISRRAAAVIRQNISLSLALKLAFVLLTVVGYTTLWMAVFADVGVSLLVTLNGMRLLNFGKTG